MTPKKEEVPQDGQAKNYDYIVKLKRLGEYNTIFATKVTGTLADKSIIVTTQRKDGTTRTAEFNSDSVESIEQC